VKVGGFVDKDEMCIVFYLLVSSSIMRTTLPCFLDKFLPEQVSHIDSSKIIAMNYLFTYYTAMVDERCAWIITNCWLELEALI